jgi:glc operon protein GlcG
MRLSQQIRLTPEEARNIIDRAINKCEDLNQAGSFVIADDGGLLLSASRMDGSGSMGIPIARAKTYEAAANREPSAKFAQRVSGRFLGLYLGYEKILRDKVFPGAGAVLIRRDGVVLGALATAGSVGPHAKFEGLDPRKLLLGDQPTNAQDLILKYAIDEPYSSEHGDDHKRWLDAYGKDPAECGPGLAHEPPARASRQKRLGIARAIADAAMDMARKRHGVAICVAVTDRHGDLVQLDRMAGAAPMSPDIAGALAHTAINFNMPTREVAELYGKGRELAELRAIAPFPLIALPGGLPIHVDDVIDGAIGIAAPDPMVADEIGRAALEAVRG